jgi:hypothetical protein
LPPGATSAEVHAAKGACTKPDDKISEEIADRPKLFADTDYTAKLFNETSGRIDIRRVAEYAEGDGFPGWLHGYFQKSNSLGA